MLALQQIGRSHEIAHAGVLAMKLAFDRKRKSIGLEEYLSGIYLTDREALLPFWRDSKKLDLFVRDICGLHEPVWFYWIDFYHTVRDDPKWRDGISAPYTRTLAGILNEAAKLALKATKKTSAGPQLGVEHFIRTLAAHPELEFSRKMVGSGMRRQALQGTIGRSELRRRRH
jgi:hypothetical protein